MFTLLVFARMLRAPVLSSSVTMESGEAREEINDRRLNMVKIPKGLKA
jgi:hypothetical protein